MSSARLDAAGRGRALLTVVAAAAGIFVVLVVMGGELDAPTVSLSVCGVALIAVVWRLFCVSRALSTPAAGVLGVLDGERIRRGDDFERLLRALKELEFDHDMGKLSDEDFHALEARYRARAVEAMRALEGEGELHPRLRALLDQRDAERTGEIDIRGHGLAEAAGEDDEAASPSGATCPSCQTANDGDARFCKGCGAALAEEA